MTATDLPSLLSMMLSNMVWAVQWLQVISGRVGLVEKWHSEWTSAFDKLLDDTEVPLE